MGYRSEGKLYLSKKAFRLAPQKIKDELLKDWEIEDDNFEKGKIYSFDCWKWYDSFDSVKEMHQFLFSLEEKGCSNDDWDFCVVGEDGAVQEVPSTYSVFHTNTIISY